MKTQDLIKFLFDDTDIREAIKEDKFITDIKNFLLEKNKKYGDSVISPVRVFSMLTSEQGILIRMDDKVNRIINNNEIKPKLNDMIDLIGYISFLFVLDLKAGNKISFNKNLKVGLTDKEKEFISKNENIIIVFKNDNIKNRIISILSHIGGYNNEYKKHLKLLYVRLIFDVIDLYGVDCIEKNYNMIIE